MQGSATIAELRRWVGRLLPARSDALRLFCFPPGGAGSLAYAAWPSLAPPGLEIVPVRLPGREYRQREPAADDVAELAAAATDGLFQHIEGCYVLYGHSFGALVAFEVARAIRARNMPKPRALVVCGLPPPHLLGRQRHAELPDETFRAYVAGLGGLPPSADPYAIARLLAAIRADCGLVERYRYTGGPPLDIGILAIAGDQDPVVSAGELRGWAEYTCADVYVTLVSGRHFPDPHDILGVVAASCLDWTLTTVTHGPSKWVG